MVHLCRFFLLSIASCTTLTMLRVGLTSSTKGLLLYQDFPFVGLFKLLIYLGPGFLECDIGFYFDVGGGGGGGFCCWMEVFMMVDYIIRFVESLY